MQEAGRSSRLSSTSYVRVSSHPGIQALRARSRERKDYRIMGMLMENEFTVNAPADKVMTYLLDVEKVAKCLPGAQLTQIVDAQTYKGKMRMKMGPLDLTFVGTVNIVEMDNENGRIVMRANGMEEKGKGMANATATVLITDQGGSTHVKLSQDLTMSGAVAQYGRGMIADVAGNMVKQFATCLSQQIR
jgi:carbon monoxide dehydrogenase subunit G